MKSSNQVFGIPLKSWSLLQLVSPNKLNKYIINFSHYFPRY